MRLLHSFSQEQIFPAKCILILRSFFLQLSLFSHCSSSGHLLSSKTHLCRLISISMKWKSLRRKRKRNHYAQNKESLCLTSSVLDHFRYPRTNPKPSLCEQWLWYKWTNSTYSLRHKRGLMVATHVGWRLFWNASCILLVCIWPCLLWRDKARMG